MSWSLLPPDPRARGARELPEKDHAEKWARWMKHHPSAKPSDPGFIWSQVVVIAHYRDIYESVTRIAVQADLPPSQFWGYLNSTYLHSQASAIRRLADTGKGTVSLRRILIELAQDLSRLGCPGYVANPANAMTAAQVRADGKRLDRDVAEVKAIVDQRVAHMSEAEVSDDLTVGRVHDAIDAVTDIFQRYEAFLTDATTDVIPLIENDWAAIFRRPWLEPLDGHEDK
jgi:hypothetical protein